MQKLCQHFGPRMTKSENSRFFVFGLFPKRYQQVELTRSGLDLLLKYPAISVFATKKQKQ